MKATAKLHGPPERDITLAVCTHLTVAPTFFWSFFSRCVSVIVLVLHSS